MSYYIGLISGTSMDGIDAALVDVDTNQLISGITYPYSEPVYQFLLEMAAENQPSLHAVFQLNAMIGKAFATAANELLLKAGINKKQITAVGSHGQTLKHEVLAPAPYSLQLGCGHVIAELTGLPVVADFRTRDMVNNGQGAPLAPIYHQEIFKHVPPPLAVVNIGGISNISFINEQGIVVGGYDTGPGNCLMDLWVKKHFDKIYDENGDWAANGKVMQYMLDAMLNDPYFKKMPPKSLDKAYFADAWLKAFLPVACKNEDIQATLLALTAKTISNEVIRHTTNIQTIILCGGGAHNQALVAAIARELSGHEVKTASSIGVNGDYIEAMMIAWLAHQTINGTAVDLNLITGAKKPAVLGVLYPAGH